MLTNIILGTGVVWALFQLGILIIRLFDGKDRVDWYVLNSTCLFFIGIIYHFVIGFPLDEGMVPPSEVAGQEARLFFADIVLLSGLIYPILWPVRVILRWLGVYEKRKFL